MRYVILISMEKKMKSESVEFIIDLMLKDLKGPLMECPVFHIKETYDEEVKGVIDESLHHSIESLETLKSNLITLRTGIH